MYEGPTIPLFYVSGLCCMKLRKPTKEELETLEPHIITSDYPWEPAVHESDEFCHFDFITAESQLTFGLTVEANLSETSTRSPVVPQVDVTRTVEVQNIRTYDQVPHVIDAKVTKESEYDYTKLIPCLGWRPRVVVDMTLLNMTQYYTSTTDCLPMQEHYKTQVLALHCL